MDMFLQSTTALQRIGKFEDLSVQNITGEVDPADWERILVNIRVVDAKLNVVCDELTLLDNMRAALCVRLRRAQQNPLAAFTVNLRLRLQNVSQVYATYHEYGLRLAHRLNYLQARAGLTL